MVTASQQVAAMANPLSATESISAKSFKRSLKTSPRNGRRFFVPSVTALIGKWHRHRSASSTDPRQGIETMPNKQRAPTYSGGNNFANS